MTMVGKADDQKHFSWCNCFLKPPLLLLVVTLIPSTAFFFYQSSHGLISSVLITATVLFISSTVLFHKLSKDKTRVVCLAGKPFREDNPGLRVQDDAATATAESQTRPCDAKEEGGMTDLPSDTDDGELGWVSSSLVDGDVSSCFDDHHRDDGDDDDGLIEIALMDDPKGNKKHDVQRLIWVDEDEDEEEEINSNEVNIEEENLIEIDISMGSIKRPTVEI